MQLAGVGDKAATVALNEIFGNVIGIGVDRHVHDIAIALGLHIVPSWVKTSIPAHVARDQPSYMDRCS